MSHSHMCRACGNVFSHTRNPNWTYEQNEQAHCCPICSSGPFYEISNLQGNAYREIPPSAVLASLVMLCMLREMVLDIDEEYGNGYSL